MVKKTLFLLLFLFGCATQVTPSNSSLLSIRGTLPGGSPVRGVMALGQSGTVVRGSVTPTSFEVPMLEERFSIVLLDNGGRPLANLAAPLAAGSNQRTGVFNAQRGTRSASGSLSGNVGLATEALVEGTAIVIGTLTVQIELRVAIGEFNILADLDSDQDGSSDLTDADDDGNGVPDDAEPAPSSDLDEDGAIAWVDLDDDGDGQNDDVDSDDDGDGSDDEVDQDSDGDGIGNDEDLDDDNDGILDTADSDCNGDGIPDAQQDSDRDGIFDFQDDDADGDGQNNDADSDDDGDGTLDTAELDCDDDGLPDFLPPGATCSTSTDDTTPDDLVGIWEGETEIELYAGDEIVTVVLDEQFDFNDDGTISGDFTGTDEPSGCTYDYELSGVWEDDLDSDADILVGWSEVVVTVTGCSNPEWNQEATDVTADEGELWDDELEGTWEVTGATLTINIAAGGVIEYSRAIEQT